MQRRPSRLRLLLGVLSLALTAASTWAQSSGSLHGTVVDSMGGVVPGAAVVLTNEATRFARHGLTGGNGAFHFGAVDAGRYTLRVEVAGFKSWEASGLYVAANDTLGASVRLEVGELDETLTVTAERQLFQTGTDAREGLVTPEQIEAAGMGGGFGATQLAYSINGARAENTGVSLDGADVRDIGNNSNMFNVPNNDFVAEVKVQTSNYAAEFGSAAVTVQAITKAGSSEFHGSAYLYTRPYQMQANDRSRNDAGRPRPESKFNYPGFTLSGPIPSPARTSTRTATACSSSSAGSGRSRTSTSARCRRSPSPKRCGRGTSTPASAGRTWTSAPRSTSRAGTRARAARCRGVTSRPTSTRSVWR